MANPRQPSPQPRAPTSHRAALPRQKPTQPRHREKMASQVHNPTPIPTEVQVRNPTQRPTAALAAKTNLIQVTHPKAKTTQSPTTSLKRTTSQKQTEVCCVKYFPTSWHATKWASPKKVCLTASKYPI